jgi:hypothetical protein
MSRQGIWESSSGSRRSRRRICASIVVLMLASAGLQGVLAPSAYAGELSLQGVTIRWNDNAFVRPNGCENYSFDWVNNSGRDLLQVRVQVFQSTGFTIFWQWAIPARAGESGTFNQVICDSRLRDGLGPYRIDLYIENYSSRGGGSFVASAPLTFLAQAPAPGSAPAAQPGAPSVPSAVTRAPKPPSQVRIKLNGTSAAVAWRGLPQAQQVQRYEVTAFPGGKSCKTKKTSCTIKGLARGRDYQFTIVAVNAAGSSSAAKSKVVRVPQTQQSRPSQARPTQTPRPSPQPSPTTKPEAEIS